MKTANKVMAVLAMVVLALSAVSTAQADAITWGAATNIAADTDVLNTGTFKYAVAFGGTSDTVNGVPFTSVSGGPGRVIQFSQVYPEA